MFSFCHSSIRRITTLKIFLTLKRQFCADVTSTAMEKSARKSLPWSCWPCPNTAKKMIPNPSKFRRGKTIETRRIGDEGECYPLWHCWMTKRWKKNKSTSITDVFKLCRRRQSDNGATTREISFSTSARRKSPLHDESSPIVSPIG